MNYWQMSNLFLFSLLYYLCWNVFNYTMIFRVCRSYIKKHDYKLLYYYFKANNSLSKKYHTEDERVNEIRYMIAHAIISTLGLIYGTVMIFQRYFTFVVLLFFLIIPVWYGSTYYHEYFPGAYGGKVQNLI